MTVILFDRTGKRRKYEITGRDQRTHNEAVAELGPKAHGYRNCCAMSSETTSFQCEWFSELRVFRLASRSSWKQYTKWLSEGIV